jgi:hypothetical protein
VRGIKKGAVLASHMASEPFSWKVYKLLNQLLTAIQQAGVQVAQPIAHESSHLKHGI